MFINKYDADALAMQYIYLIFFSDLNATIYQTKYDATEDATELLNDRQIIIFPTRLPLTFVNALHIKINY